MRAFVSRCVALGVIALGIAGCTGARTAGGTLNPMDGATPSLVLESSYRTATAGPSATVPPATLAPSLSLLARTPKLTSDLITPPAKPASGEEWIRRSVSPDGEWIAEERWDHRSERLTFKIFNTGQSKSWTILDHEFRLGAIQPELLGWSSDSRHFYYRYLGSDEAGEGKCEPFGVKAGLRLYRFDVGSGATALISLPEGIEHAISPDETKLAYVKAGEPPELVIRDVAGGAEQTFPVPRPPSLPPQGKLIAGEIVWSPDGSQLVLSAVTYVECGTMSPAILKFDLATHSFSELVALDSGGIYPTRWPVEERILITAWGGSSWWIDAATGTPAEAPAKTE